MSRVVIAVALLVAACGNTASPETATLAEASARETERAPSPTSAPSAAPAGESPATPSPTPALPSGVLAVVQLSYLPSGIIATDEALWAEDHAKTNAVYRIDPATGRSTTKIPVTRPCDLVAAFGRVWVADLDGGRLLAMDPMTGEAGDAIDGFRRPCGPSLIDGAIWMAVDDGIAKVGRDGKAATFELPGGAFPGAGSPLWAVRFDNGDVYRIDQTSGAVRTTVPAPGGRVEGPPLAIAAGSLWYGDARGGRVLRLDPKTGKTRAAIAASRPTRFLVTDAGIWVTSFDTGVVERIDPATDQVVYRASIGGNANGIAEGFGAIWVADTGQGRLFRIDPQATGINP